MSDHSSHTPDLDESTSVLTDAAAVSREHQVLSEGAEPISLWVILGSAIVVLIGGGVLFGGSLFDYKDFVKSGYVRQDAPGQEGGEVVPKPAIVAYSKIGEKKSVSCKGCHGNNGEGSGAIPPLAGSEWVTGPALRPAMIILNGCKGPITVAGKSYNGNMPAQGDGLSAKDLAGLLNYIRTSFGNSSDKLITIEMAEDAIAISKERGGGQMTAPELDEKYSRELKGEPLDPNTLVDPKTLEPAKAE
ncbi:cytochrome c [Oceaniferula spumae]|uniref:Cytochrome c n=1 Tax=Oceaniferula spumae TaxID=2979115 RepID=A0AAT9FPB3_9BACT